MKKNPIYFTCVKCKKEIKLNPINKNWNEVPKKSECCGAELKMQLREAHQPTEPKEKL